MITSISITKLSGSEQSATNLNSKHYLFEFPPNELQAADGKSRYELLKTKIPVYGACWAEAVEELHVGCKHLTEEIQSRLALTFANCFLRKSGMKGYSCPPNEKFEDCMRNVDDRTFSSYREFFTYTQSICFFLQSQMWQNQVKDTITKLTTSSKELGAKLENAKETQIEMLRLQNLSVSEQQQLRRTNINLNKQVEDSRNKIRDVFEELKTTTLEHRILIIEVFERISKLNNLVLGGVVNFYTVMFYVVSTFTSYLFTSTPRTQGARFWLFTIMALNAVLEKMISTFSIEEESKTNILLDDTGPIYYRIWFCRNVTCIVAVITVIYFAFRYKDYNVINNQLLADIHRQNAELKNCLKNMGNSFSNHRSNSSISSTDESCAELDSNKSSCDETYHCTTSSDESDSYTSMNSTISLASELPSTDSGFFNNNIYSENSPMTSLASPDRSSTPTLQAVPTGRYNLRPRCNRITVENVALQSESPKAFQRVIENLRAVSQRNSHKIRRQRTRQAEFSDDD